MRERAADTVPDSRAHTVRKLPAQGRKQQRPELNTSGLGPGGYAAKNARRKYRPSFRVNVPDYGAMPRVQRNSALRQMLDKDSVVVFPDRDHETCDGLPYFTIMMHDLKYLIQGKGKPLEASRRVTRKPRVDMGIPKQNMENE